MPRSRVPCLLLVVLCVASIAASPLPPGAVARLGSTDLWHGPAVHEVAFAPDGKTFYSLGSADMAARQWDVATGAELRAFAGHKARPSALAVSRDGRLLVTAAPDRTVCLWNTTTGEVVTTWTRKLPPLSVAIAPDSKTVAILPGDEPGSAAVLDAVSGKELTKFEVGDPMMDRRGFGPFGRVAADEEDLRPEGTVVFSPDGRFLAVHASQMVTLWDAQARKRVRRYDAAPTDVRRVRGLGMMGDMGGYMSLHFAADSQTLLAAGGDANVLRWEVSSIDELEPLKCDGAVSVAAATNGDTIAAVGQGGLSIWNREGRRLHHLSADDAGLVAVACAPDGKTVVTGDRQGRLRVWDVATGKERLQPGSRPLFRTLAVNVDGAVTADEFSLRRWDLAGKELKQLKLDPASVTELLLSPDGRTLAVRRTEGDVRLLDAATCEARATLAVKDRRLTTLQFSADGRWLAAFDSGPSAADGAPFGRVRGARATPRGTVSVYDTRTGKQTRQLKDSPSAGDQFVFLADGRSLVTMASGASLCVWETLTGKARRQLASEPVARTRDDAMAELLAMRGGGFVRGAAAVRKFSLAPQQLAVSPDGSTIAAVQRTTVSLVELQTGKRVGRLEGHSGIISCVTYSPDGRLLVTGGNDQAVHLWEGATGKEIGTLAGHRGPVRLAAFTPDGKKLVTTAEDQTALVWDVAEAVKIARQAGRTVAKPRALDALWTGLADADAQEADTVVRELASRPAETLALLKERLRPAKVVDAKQLAKWVAQLDDDDFAVRERAVTDLDRAGEQARTALEMALKNQQSQEVKRLVMELLKKLEAREYSFDLVREMRALETLEKIGSPEAAKLLETLASGAASDPRTVDAKAALERLRRK